MLPTVIARGQPASQDAAVAAALLTYAQQRYGNTLGANGRTELTEAALSGLMGSVKDPYTVYPAPREIQGLDESLKGGNFGGIGVYIYQLKDGRILIQPIEGMPAAHAGMKPGQKSSIRSTASPFKGLTMDAWSA